MGKDKAKVIAQPAWALPTLMQYSLLALMLLNLLSLVSQLAPWFMALTLVCLLFHLAICLKWVKQPSRMARVFIALSGCTLLALTGRELGLLLGMLHLLSLAYLLKPFELTQQRDFYLQIIVGLLLLTCSFIFHQSLFFALVIAVLVMLNLSYVLRYFTREQSWQFQMKKATSLLLQSIPLAIVLFIVFPKIPPFWQMPTANSAKTGLSDRVKVGDIANLALSNELAFRVEFDSQVPPYQQMYWRALTLSEFDGRQWRKRRRVTIKPRGFSQSTLSSLASGDKQISYQVIAEPSHQYWLFGLDVAIVKSAGKEIRQLVDYSLLSRERLTQPFAYQVVSYTNQPLAIEVDQLARYRQINVSDNPELSRYGQQLAAKFVDEQAAIIQTVLTRFRQQNYRYTLSPPALTNNSLDEFFFDTQAGFCEHYASSFTYLMRAAGIPARLVLGYLGGEYNQQGQYYSVYQRDAHAWSEVWLDDQGWIRIDPTAAVDPSRVEQGFSSQLLSEQQQLAPGINLGRWFGATWLELRMQLEAIDYHWTKLVINYSEQDQRHFLKHWLGNKIALKATLILVASFIAAVVCVWLIQQYRRQLKARGPVWLNYYRKAHQHLATLGIVRDNQMPDHQFIKYLNQQKPELTPYYQKVLQCYYRLQYQPCESGMERELIQAMKLSVNQLRTIR